MAEIGTVDAVDATPSMEDATDARGVASHPSRGRSDPTMDITNEEDLYTEEYNMGYPKRGMAVIISNKNFEKHTRMGVRTGTDKDCRDIKVRLKDLDFEVHSYEDLKRADMEGVLKQAALNDHHDKDCFLCVILSHGEEGTVYGTDGPIQIQQLLDLFKGDKCRSLVGKPKLFFIQACRGTSLDHGVEMTDALGYGKPKEVNIQRIPIEADFLIAYSVVPGYFSWRNSANGSWFIQAICEVFKKFGKNLDLMTLMTRVNKKVAYDFQSNASQEFMNNKKQIPCITSMLTKDVYFRPKSY